MSEQKRPTQKRNRAHRERANKNMIEFFFSDCLNDYYLFLKQRKISVAFLYILIAYTIQYTHTNNDKENEQRKKKKMYKGMEQKNWIRVQQITNMGGGRQVWLTLKYLVCVEFLSASFYHFQLFFYYYNFHSFSLFYGSNKNWPRNY